MLSQRHRNFKDANLRGDMALYCPKCDAAHLFGFDMVKEAA